MAAGIVSDGNSINRKKIVAMAPYERGWTNVELVKDCGLIPYLLYKNHGCDSYMAGAGGGQYTYNEIYTKGMGMEFLPGGRVSDKCKYIEDNAAEIDALLLRGCYSDNFPVAKLYKKLNPAGKIYTGLDANSGWMDRIIWDNSSFTGFMDCCDVIATSCKAMQRYLNEKWPWKIEYIPNGYYDFIKKYTKPVFEEKDNVILTVGRLGTRQKATEVLMEAFAVIADRIPEWKLRLAGSVDKDFEGYIHEYNTRFPDLYDRICFTGVITDREELAGEYHRAKIFALPSAFEGGTPNVIAEALYAGCVTAVTKWDAYEDATDSGRCGMAADIGDKDEYAELLYRLCTCNNLNVLSEHAYRYGRTNFDMEKAVARINEMLFGGAG